MFRGFVSGLLWGAVVAVIGLGVVSLTSPPPEQAPSLAEAPSVPAPDPAPPEAPVPEPEPEPPEVPEPEPVETAEPEPEPATEPAPVETARPDPAPPAPEPAPGALPGLPAAPAGALTLAPPPALVPSAPRPAPMPGPASPEAAPQAALAPEPPAPGAAAPVPERPVGTPPDAAPSRPGPEAGPPGPGLPPVPEGAGADGLAALSPAAPPPPAGTPAPEPVVIPAPEPEPEPEPQEAAQAPRPQPGFSGAVDGVRSNRLPRIGAAPPPEPEAAPALQLDPEAAPALRRNARAFANPEGKPPFAILLLDTGDAALDLAALASSDVPLTLLVDPAAPGAAERAEVWRAAGQEVALLATALPRGAAATDMEVAMEALAAHFPQALALVDPAEGGMQGDRARAGALMPALRARGFGLVTWDRGLNPADQIARREGLPAVTIFRELDREAEAAAVVRRYLDRAAFKAQQDGQAVVFGRLRPETLAAVLEWALDGRAAALALAPLSAVLR